MAKIEKMCQKSAFLVVPSQNHWKWPTLSTIVQAPWSKKSYFSDFSINIWYLYTFIRTNRYISETALPITETKKRKHFAIESTPQNLGKLTSETTFGHSKVVFRPLLRTKRTFSQNPPMSRFWIFFLVIPDTFSIPKSLTEVMGNFFSKPTLSSHVHANYGGNISGPKIWIK